MKTFEEAFDRLVPTITEDSPDLDKAIVESMERISQYITLQDMMANKRCIVHMMYMARCIAERLIHIGAETHEECLVAAMTEVLAANFFTCARMYVAIGMAMQSLDLESMGGREGNTE